MAKYKPRQRSRINLNLTQRSLLREFRRRVDLKAVMCDKNLGQAIMTVDDYREVYFKYLLSGPYELINTPVHGVC